MGLSRPRRQTQFGQFYTILFRRRQGTGKHSPFHYKFYINDLCTCLVACPPHELSCHFKIKQVIILGEKMTGTNIVLSGASLHVHFDLIEGKILEKKCFF